MTVMQIVGKVISPLFNIGIGQLPGMTQLYRFAWGHFGLKGIQLAEVDGSKMYVICKDWAVAPTMLFAHTWEPAETAIFKRYIKEGMTVIDAGAYIGYFSILSSRLVGNTGAVYSFEPSPDNAAVLRKNVELNSCINIRVIQQAVSNCIGQATFYPNPQNSSGSTMFNNYSTVRKAEDPKIVVPTTTLDKIVGDSKVDFVKMDIEGGETAALKGMQGIIKNNPELKMIVELFPIGLKRVGSSLEEFVDSLQQHFFLYIIEKDGSTSFTDLAGIRRAVKKTAVINLFCERR